MKRKLLLIGGGGHCSSVTDSILQQNVYDELGIIDPVSNNQNNTIPVIGKDDDIPNLFLEGWSEAFITIGSVGNTNIRRRLYQMIKKIGFSIPVIIDPSAIIADKTTIKDGTYIGKGVIINSGSIIDECAIINTRSLIDHDCKIGAFSHTSPGSILCGEVCIGTDTHIGAGSIVRQQIKIGNNVMIGIGSCVVKNIPDNVTAYGNPCRISKLNS